MVSQNVIPSKISPDGKHKDVMLEINSIKQAIENQGNNIELIFEYLKQFEASRQQELEQKNHRPVGFKTIGKNKG